MSGWAALAGAAAELTNNAVGYYLDRKLMKQQFEYQKEVLQNQNQWRADDLRAAGLNPVLTTGISSSANSGVTIPSSRKGSLDIVGSMATAKQMELTGQQTKTEKERTNTQVETTKLVAAQTLEAMNNAYLKQEQIFNAQVERQIMNLNLSVQEAQSLVSKMRAQFELDWAELWKVQQFAATAQQVVDVIPIGKYVGQALNYILGKGKKPTLIGKTETYVHHKTGGSRTTEFHYDR